LMVPETAQELEWEHRNKWKTMHKREVNDDFYNYGFNARSISPPRARKPNPVAGDHQLLANVPVQPVLELTSDAVVVNGETPFEPLKAIEGAEQRLWMRPVRK